MSNAMARWIDPSVKTREAAESRERMLKLVDSILKERRCKERNGKDKKKEELNLKGDRRGHLRDADEHPRTL